MKCPVCKTEKLSPVKVEEGLHGARCLKCEGLWILGRDYQDWLRALPEKDHVSPDADEMELLPTDIKMAKICCICFRLMSKYKVGYQLDFALERCTYCGGIWFDKHEWETLRKHQLHHRLNMLLTASYQRHLRDQASRQAMEEHYKEKFGEATYAELLRVRMWLETHERREELLSYLNDPDPTKA